MVIHASSDITPWLLAPTRRGRGRARLQMIDDHLATLHDPAHALHDDGYIGANGCLGVRRMFGRAAGRDVPEPYCVSARASHSPSSSRERLLGVVMPHLT